jgi:hypothetical protein
MLREKERERHGLQIRASRGAQVNPNRVLNPVRVEFGPFVIPAKAGIHDTKNHHYWFGYVMKGFIGQDNCQ